MDLAFASRPRLGWRRHSQGRKRKTKTRGEEKKIIMCRPVPHVFLLSTCEAGRCALPELFNAMRNADMNLYTHTHTPTQNFGKSIRKGSCLHMGRLTRLVHDTWSRTPTLGALTYKTHSRHSSSSSSSSKPKKTPRPLCRHFPPYYHTLIKYPSHPPPPRPLDPWAPFMSGKSPWTWHRIVSVLPSPLTPLSLYNKSPPQPPH